jgi:phosphoribosylanthranilate isomerase
MVKVKICGVTNLADALMCVKSGADYVGNIINIPSSPRSISQEDSEAIISRLPQDSKGIIVMAPKSISEAVKAVEIVRPWGVQLHGRESLNFVENLIKEVDCEVIKVVQVEGQDSINEALALSRICNAILLDTPSSRLGGSGKKHDWNISSEIVSRAKCKVFLAGGLTPENVGEAVKTVSPFCIDASSGVEKSPGLKMARRVRRFIKEAKNPS